MTPLLLLVAALLIVAAIALRRSTGLPWARVKMSDTIAWRRAEQSLVARRWGLIGKPDYLIEVRGGLVPVEVKPGRRASRPYASDLLQLAAYCLLVEDQTGRRPPYGLLRYADTTFRVRYDDDLRSELIAVLAEMRAATPAAGQRSHKDPARCRGCGFVRQCDQALA